MRRNSRTCNYRLFALNRRAVAVTQRFYGYGSCCDFVIANDERVARAAGVGLFHLAFEAAATTVLSDRQTRVA